MAGTCDTFIKCSVFLSCNLRFELNGEFDICVTVIEVVQKLVCCVFIVEQGEGIVHVLKLN